MPFPSESIRAPRIEVSSAWRKAVVGLQPREHVRNTIPPPVHRLSFFGRAEMVALHCQLEVVAGQ
ncbi:hypothetical protein CBOM_07610 [Ceraceosorus bombacis]|uniref:Uncharacterized protein n=1 Tax=Ceraceosorus bombacis TaxID=401625 RepID=A0A0P1BFL2_9BASI|nr:hypothetical protein CBOM_07610 [Ceraceosorus bombacis]